MIRALLFIPGASHFHQFLLLVVADITRAERVSCTPRAPMSARSHSGDNPRHPHTRRNPLTTRTLNRRALRDQNDEVETIVEESDSGDSDETPSPKVKKARARKATSPAVKKPARTRKKTAKVPQTMFARWAVCDNGMKRIAVFEYKDRVGADAKLAAIRDSKAGTFFIMLVKDPYDPPAEPTSPTSA